MSTIMNLRGWTGILFVILLSYSSTSSAQIFDHSYALVIGIDHYKASHRWHNLGYAVKDAKALAEYLSRHDYTVVSLYEAEATKEGILEVLQNSIAPKLGSNDRVLVFFAGHGYTEQLGGRDRGYIVPFDGNEKSASYISMEEIIDESNYMSAARHQLFLMDSCYSGVLTLRGGKIPSSVPDDIQELARRTARQVITAGGKDQQVQDNGPGGHSVFMHYVLEALDRGAADFNKDGFVTAGELATYLQSTATSAYQTPASGTLSGHGGGEYLFRVGESSNPANVRKSMVVSTSNSASVRSGETGDKFALDQRAYGLFTDAYLAFYRSQYREAANGFTEVLRLQPDNPAAYDNRALCYYNLHEYEKAKSDADKAIAIQPTAHAFYTHSLVYYALKNIPEAMRDLNEAIRLNPSGSEYYRLLGQLYEDSNEMEFAIREYGEAIKRAPSDKFLYDQRAHAYYVVKDYSAAVSDYNRSIEIDPNQFDAVMWRGHSYNALKRYKEALSDYERALQINPDSKTAQEFRDSTRMLMNGTHAN